MQEGRAVVGFHGVRYQVKDVSRSVAFYTHHLGFKLEHQQLPAFANVSIDTLHVLLSGPGASGSRPLPDGRQQEPGGWNRIVLRVPDLPARVDALKKAGPKGKAGPLTGVDGWYINQSAKNVDGAIALALALTNADSQKVYADVAGDVPVRTDVTVSDPLVKAFSDASATGFARPQSVEFGNYWTPFGDAVTKIVEGKSTPQAGIAEACAAMNKANKK